MLADKNWTWIDKNRVPEFVHSIFGMITILFALIQVNFIFVYKIEIKAN